MTYKIKSLIYLSCFVVAALIYNNVEREDEFQNQLHSKTVVETEFEDSNELTETKEDFSSEQQ